ncbi:hypothetical protein AHAS_Ahas14G0236200 [Arachis hypogaea]
MNIYQLDISQAQISSSVPDWHWDQFFKIWNLNLSHNHIRGKIEDRIVDPHRGLTDNLVIVQTIDLSFNLFEGPIPAFFSTAAQLFLSSNRFSNANPLLCANSSINTKFMDLSNNYIRGQLPDCWMGYEFLAILDLSDNHFHGNMPKSLGSLKHIESIHLGGNHFSGEIPSSLHNCTKLRVFDAADNQLSGKIPSWIGGNIQKLLVLNLHSNKLHGSIPLSICNLHELFVLDLSLNILSGNIPPCISNLSAMATLTSSSATITHGYLVVDIHNSIFERIGRDFPNFGVYNDSTSVIWKGKMSTYERTLGLLRGIDFSSNRLTGEIPSEVMSLIGLVSLNLSRNLFSGHIPPTVGHLKSIDFLDLSRNHLSGTIPSQLAQIDRLSVLDLSYNDLSGEIPLGTQLQTRDASAYAGNPKLCGAPLNNTCPIHGHQISEHDADGDDEQFVTEGFYIAMAVGFVMAFWGVCFSLILKKSWRYAYFKQKSIQYLVLKRALLVIARIFMHVCRVGCERVPTAIQLYDLQDRLGLNQPSKVVDWLLNAAKHEIDELPPLPHINNPFTTLGGFPSSSSNSMINNTNEASTSMFNINRSIHQWQQGLAQNYSKWNNKSKSSSSTKQASSEDNQMVNEEDNNNNKEEEEGEEEGANVVSTTNHHHHPSFLGLLNTMPIGNYQFEQHNSSNDVNVAQLGNHNHGFITNQTDLQSINLVPFPSTLSLSTGGNNITQSYFPSHSSEAMDPRQEQQINHHHHHQYHQMLTSHHLHQNLLTNNLPSFSLAMMSTPILLHHSHNTRESSSHQSHHKDHHFPSSK